MGHYHQSWSFCLINLASSPLPSPVQNCTDDPINSLVFNLITTQVVVTYVLEIFLARALVLLIPKFQPSLSLKSKCRIQIEAGQCTKLRRLS